MNFCKHLIELDRGKSFWNERISYDAILIVFGKFWEEKIVFDLLNIYKHMQIVILTQWYNIRYLKHLLLDT